MTNRTLGFIGLGDMGGPMAGRLIDAGHRVSLFDVREAAMAPLVEKGGERAGSPQEVAARAETVLVSLPTPDVVKEVALGPRGIRAGTAARAYVDLSTTGPTVAAEVAAGLAEAGIAALDCPVSGGSRGAAAGTLTLMVSGPKDLHERLRPVLDVLGSRQVHVGERVGLGQTMKLVNNYLSAVSKTATPEAMVFGVKAGLDPEVMLEVLNSSSGCNNVTRNEFPTFVLPRTFHSGFTTRLLHKDVKLAMEEAEALGVPMWVGNAVRQFLAFAVSQGHGPESSTALVKLVEGWAGVTVGTEDPS